jgi:hypothetical protein
LPVGQRAPLVNFPLRPVSSRMTAQRVNPTPRRAGSHAFIYLGVGTYTATTTLQATDSNGVAPVPAKLPVVEQVKRIFLPVVLR